MCSKRPIFLFLKGLKEIDRFEGANPKRLEDTIKLHYSGAGTSPFSGKGQTLGGAPAPAAPAGGTEGLLNLTPQAKVLVGLIAAYILLWYFS